MKKYLIATAVIGLLAFAWHGYNDGKYDPNARYIGHRQNYVFHKKYCKKAKRMAENNRFYSVTRKKLVDKGMRPAGCCRP